MSGKDSNNGGAWEKNLRTPIKSPSKDKPFTPTVPKAPQFATEKRAQMASMSGSVDLTSEAGSVLGSPRHERKVSGPFGRVPAKPSPLSRGRSNNYDSEVASPVRRGGNDGGRFDWATSLRPTTQSHGEGRRREWSANTKPLRASSTSPNGRQPLTPRRAAAAGMETVPESPTVQPRAEDAVPPPEPPSPQVTGKVGSNIPHFRQGSNIPAAPKELRPAGAPTRLTPKKKSVDLSGREYEIAPPPFAVSDEPIAPPNKPGVSAPRAAEPEPQQQKKEEAVVESDALAAVDEAEDAAGSDGGSAKAAVSPTKRQLFNPITHEPLPYAANKQFGRGRGHLPSSANAVAAAQRAPFATALNTPEDDDALGQEQASAPREVDVPDFSTMQAHPTKIEAVDLGDGDDEGPSLAEAFATKKAARKAAESSPRTAHRRGRSGGKAHFMQPTQSALSHARVPAKIAAPMVVIGSGSSAHNSPAARRTPPAMSPAFGAGPAPSPLAASSEETVVVTRSRPAAPEPELVEEKAPVVEEEEAAPAAVVEEEEAAPAPASRDFQLPTEDEVAVPEAAAADDVEVVAPTPVVEVEPEQEVEEVVKAAEEPEQKEEEEEVVAAAPAVEEEEEEQQPGISKAGVVAAAAAGVAGAAGIGAAVAAGKDEDEEVQAEEVKEADAEDIEVKAPEADSRDIEVDALADDKPEATADESFAVPDANDFTIPEGSAITAEDAGLPAAPAVEVTADEAEAEAEAAASRDVEIEAEAEGASADATATADLQAQAPAAIKTRQVSEAAAVMAEPLKHTPAGQKLIGQAQVVAQMTVKEAVGQLASGTVVYKAWVRDGGKQKGSTRHVKAKVLNDLVLLTYQSGLAKKTQTVVVIRCCLTIEADKTTLLLETDNGTLAVKPSTPQHETLWALGVNAMLHLAEKQDRLDQSLALQDLPWHGIVQGEE